MRELDNATFLRSVDRSNPETKEAVERLEIALGLLAELRQKSNKNKETYLLNFIENLRGKNEN